MSVSLSSLANQVSVAARRLQQDLDSGSGGSGDRFSTNMPDPATSGSSSTSDGISSASSNFLSVLNQLGMALSPTGIPQPATSPSNTGTDDQASSQSSLSTSANIIATSEVTSGANTPSNPAGGGAPDLDSAISDLTQSLRNFTTAIEGVSDGKSGQGVHHYDHGHHVPASGASQDQSTSASTSPTTSPSPASAASDLTTPSTSASPPTMSASASSSSIDSLLATM